MDTNVLRVFTGHYVVESDLVAKDKLELLKFVKIAEHQELLSFLAHGEVVEVTTENKDLIVETEDFVTNLIEAGHLTGPQPDIPNVKKSKEAMRRAGNAWRGASKTKKVVAAGTALAVSALAAKKLLKKRKCKKLAAGDTDKYNKCMA